MLRRLGRMLWYGGTRWKADSDNNTSCGCGGLPYFKSLDSSILSVLLVVVLPPSQLILVFHMLWLISQIMYSIILCRITHYPGIVFVLDHGSDKYFFNVTKFKLYRISLGCFGKIKNKKNQLTKNKNLTRVNLS